MISGRRVILALGVLIAVAAAAAPAAGESPPRPFGPLARQIAALFPAAAGDVLEVQGSRLTLGVGRRAGLLPGVEMEVFREGRELRHPRTGEVLGRTEQVLGHATVTEVLDAYAVAEATGGIEVRAGDRARLPAGRIRLTLVALSSGVRDAQVEAAVRELSEELAASGRFQAVAGDVLLARLAAAGVPATVALEGQGLREAAGAAPASPLVVVLFTRAQRRPLMEVRVFPRAGAAPMFSTSLLVPAAVKPPPRGQFSADPRPRPAVPRQRSLLARLLWGDLEAGTYSSGEASIPLREVGRLAFPVLALDAATAPGDGVPRVALTEGSHVHLYRLAGDSLELEWSHAAWQTGRVVSVQLVDLDGDGALEVVVNRYHPQQGIGLTSFVLATRQGRPVRVGQEMNEILLAVDARGGGVKDTLWAQQFSPDGFFTQGDAQRLELRAGRLAPAEAAQVPADFRATGAVLSNIAGKEGPRALVYVDPFQRLRVAMGAEERWRSGTAVGGSRHVKLEVAKAMDQSGRSFFYHAETPPVSVDLDGDGLEEIIVPMSQAPGHLAVAFRGPAGYRLQTVNTGFEGTITGLGALRRHDQQTPTLLLAVVRFTGVLQASGETQIIATVPED